ncbi:hypothetical protein [Halococcus sediminicola]|uniref:hypothetical protein n=1 Tax=Halococcus sediminicola TaxID=1264579 RepID=UPI001F1DFE9E|nr:hypothetical protein [Halococcus sediminicola]
MKLLLRFVLALVAFVVLLSPFSAIFTPPDPFSQLIFLGAVTPVTIPVAIVFVRRSYSLKCLYGYLLAVNVLVVPVGLVIGGIGIIGRAFVGRIASLGTLAGVVIVGVAYALAFHLVYRGGYARLKSGFA